MFAEYEDYYVYLNSCKGHERTHEQQLQLLQAYREGGDLEARDEFVRAQLGWVAQVLMRHYRNSGCLMDLIQDANLQLLHLVDIYNPGAAKFRTYAEPIIVKTAETNRAGYTHVTSVTTNALKKSKRVRDKWDECIQNGMDNQRALMATVDFYVQMEHNIGYYDLSDTQKRNAVECVRGLLSLTRSELSLDTPMGEDGDETFTLGSIIGNDAYAPEAMAMTAETKAKLREAIRSLTKRQQFVVIRSFGLYGYSQLRAVEIAAALGVSRQRVNTILNDALRTLRAYLES